jgi:hypothetical protein
MGTTGYERSHAEERKNVKRIWEGAAAVRKQTDGDA